MEQNLLFIPNGTSPYYLYDPNNSINPTVELKAPFGVELTDALSPDWNGLYALRNNNEYNILLGKWNC